MKKLDLGMIAIYAGFGVMVFLFLLKLFPGLGNILPSFETKSETASQAKIERKVIDFNQLKSENPVDFSFMQKTESSPYPSLKDAFAKRHYNARIDFFSIHHLKFTHPLVVGDFLQDGAWRWIVVEYSYRYGEGPRDIRERVAGTVNYCATVRRDEKKMFHLILERRPNNVADCMIETRGETFDYIFVPTEEELGPSRNRIEFSILKSLRNKDLSEMTEEEKRMADQ